MSRLSFPVSLSQNELFVFTVMLDNKKTNKQIYVWLLCAIIAGVQMTDDVFCSSWSD